MSNYSEKLTQYSRSTMGQTIWIARHGNRLDFVNPDWFNSAERPYDPPLSEDGTIQARELGERLASENIAHIFASPFLRTVQTATEISKILNLPIQLEAGLSEWLNPDWMPRMPERLPGETLARQYPIDLSYRSRVVPEYPEDEERVMARTAETVKGLVAEFSEDILLVGHGASVVGTTTGLVGGQPTVNASLCCLVKVVRDSEGWKMVLNGDTSHLSQPQRSLRFN